MTTHQQFLMRVIRFAISPLVLVLILTTVVTLQPQEAHAQTVSWSGICVAGANNDVATIQGAQCLIANVFMVVITLIGLIGFVMFMVGALQWMVSGTNTQGVQKSRSTMLYSVVGLVVALSAFIIINLIADFTGVNVIRNFKIPSSTRGIGPGSCSTLHPNASCMPTDLCSGTSYGPGTCTTPGHTCCGP